MMCGFVCSECVSNWLSTQTQGSNSHYVLSFTLVTGFHPLKRKESGRWSYT